MRKTSKLQADLSVIREAAKQVVETSPQRFNRRGMLWTYRPFGKTGFEPECFAGRILTQAGFGPSDFKGECRGVRLIHDKNPDQLTEEAWDWLNELQILADKQDQSKNWGMNWKQVLNEHEQGWRSLPA